MIKNVFSRIQARNIAIIYKNVTLSCRAFLDIILERLQTYNVDSYILSKDKTNTLSVYLHSSHIFDFKTSNSLKFDGLDLESVYTLKNTQEINVFIQAISENSVDFEYSEDKKAKISLFNPALVKEVDFVEDNEAQKLYLDYHKDKILENQSLDSCFYDYNFLMEENASVRPSDLSVEAFVKSKIDIADDNEIFLGSIKSMNFLTAEIKNILNEDISIQEKQLMLENLHTPFARQAARLKYKLSSGCQGAVLLINMIVSSRELRGLTPVGMQEEAFSLFKNEKTMRLFGCADIKRLKRELNDFESGVMVFKEPRFSEKEKLFLCKLMIYFEILNSYKEDFGLLLVHSLANTFRSLITPEGLSEIVTNYEKHDSYKTLAYKTKELLQKGAVLEASLFMKRTNLKMQLSKQCIQHFKSVHRFMSFNKEKQKNLFHVLCAKRAGFLKKVFDKKNDLDLSALDKELFYLKEDSDSIVFTFSEEDEIKLSDFLITLLESVGLISQDLGKVHDDSGIKTVWNTTASSSFLKQSFSLGHVGANLPFLVKPLDWQRTSREPHEKELSLEISKRAESFELNYGGFHSSKQDVFPSTHIYGKQGYTSANAEHLVALNYIQSIPRRINKNFLAYILGANFNRLLLYYCESPLVSFDFESSIKEDHPESIFSYREGRLVLKSQKEYIDTLANLLAQKNDPDKSAFVISATRDLKLKAVNHYIRQVAIATSFFNIVFLAETFVGYNIYFSWFFDYRHRVYPVSASLLGPQGCDLSKALLDVLPTPSVENHMAPSEGCLAYVKTQEQAWLNKFLKDKSKVFSYLKNLKGFNEKKFVSMDVSSSGVQLYSGLCGFELGLLLTNLICDPKKRNIEKEDFYKTFYNIYMKSVKESYKKTEKNKILFRFFSDNMDRTALKLTILSYLYSEGLRSRALRIQEDIFTSKGIEPQYFSDLKMTKGDMYAFCADMGKALDQLFKDNYPEIHELKSILEVRLSAAAELKERKGVFLYLTKESTQTFYKLTRFDSISVKTRGPGGKTISVNYLIDTDRFDYNSAKHKVCVNFIHRLDAELLLYTVLKAREKKIPLNVAHDSFYTFAIYQEEIKNFYFQGFKKIMLESNVLDNYIEVNSKTLFDDEAIKAVLEKHKKNKESLVKKINNGSLVQSPFVLTP